MLCPCARHLILCLVLVQPRNWQEDMILFQHDCEIVDWDVNYQHKQKKPVEYVT